MDDIDNKKYITLVKLLDAYTLKIDDFLNFIKEGKYSFCFTTDRISFIISKIWENKYLYVISKIVKECENNISIESVYSEDDLSAILDKIVEETSDLEFHKHASGFKAILDENIYVLDKEKMAEILSFNLVEIMMAHRKELEIRND